MRPQNAHPLNNLTKASIKKPLSPTKDTFGQMSSDFQRRVNPQGIVWNLFWILQKMYKALMRLSKKYDAPSQRRFPANEGTLYFLMSRHMTEAGELNLNNSLDHMFSKQGCPQQRNRLLSSDQHVCQILRICKCLCTSTEEFFMMGNSRCAKMVLIGGIVSIN